MTNPKFFPGEVVILQSVKYPEFNGEHIVRRIMKDGDEYKCRHSGKTLVNRTSSPILYILEDILTAKSEKGSIVEIGWKESALRKKHIPGEMSFTELMSKLTIKEGA